MNQHQSQASQQSSQTPLINQSRKLISSDQENASNNYRSADHDYEEDKTVIIDVETYQSILQEEIIEHQQSRVAKKSDQELNDLEKTQGVFLHKETNSPPQQPPNNNFISSSSSVMQQPQDSITFSMASEVQHQQPMERVVKQQNKAQIQTNQILNKADQDKQKQHAKDASQAQQQQHMGQPQAQQPVEYTNTNQKQNQQSEQQDNRENKNDELDDYDQSDEDQDKLINEFVETSPSGRFKRFDEELGRGAYKTVYRGVDHDTGREIAWSIICLGRLPKSERPRIKFEIKIIKELNHPNIITFISAWICKEKEQIHFITEIITGGSLRQYLKKMGKPKLKVIKKWCHEILEGLSYLHDNQTVPIIHRDIKCDNIFINSNSGEIKIGDLGLSTTMKNSYTSSVLGTPEFMAPELYEEYYGTEVDIYAFGMALLEMLTREAPYRECQNPAQIYRKVINRQYPISLERIKQDEVKSFIMWCLDERATRPTAKQLLVSEFMSDTTSEINNHYVEIAEDLKYKIPKKKKMFKNNMPDIQEDPINEEMEIKAQNSQKMPEGVIQYYDKNVQALANQGEKLNDGPDQLNANQVKDTIKPREPEQLHEDKKTGQLSPKRQVQQTEQPQKMQKQPSLEQQHPIVVKQPPIQAVNTQPSGRQQEQLHVWKQSSQTMLQGNQIANPPIKQSEVKNKNHQEVLINGVQTEKTQKEDTLNNLQANFNRSDNSNDSDFDQYEQEKLNQTIIYLKHLDDQKANRLQLDDSKQPCYYESGEDEYEMRADLDMNNLDMKKTSSHVENMTSHFVDPKQINLGNEKQANDMQIRAAGKMSFDQAKNKLEPDQQKTVKPKNEKPVKMVEANLLQQLQEEFAMEEQGKRRKEKKEEEQQELRRQKQLLKESILKSHKPQTANVMLMTGTGGTGNTQSTPAKEQFEQQRRNTIKQTQDKGHDIGKQIQTANNMGSSTQDSSQKPVVQKKLKKEDLDKETSKIKKFKEDETKQLQEIQQQLTTVNRGGIIKKSQHIQKVEILTPTKNEETNPIKQQAPTQPHQKQAQQHNGSEKEQHTSQMHKTAQPEKQEASQKQAVINSKRDKEIHQVQQLNSQQKPRETNQDQLPQDTYKRHSDKHQAENNQQVQQHQQQAEKFAQQQYQIRQSQIQKIQSGYQEMKITDMQKDKMIQSQLKINKQELITQDKKVLKKQHTLDQLPFMPMTQETHAKQLLENKAKQPDSASSSDWTIVNQQKRVPVTEKQTIPIQQQVHQQPMVLKMENEVPKQQVKKHHQALPSNQVGSLQPPIHQQMVNQTHQTVLALAQQEQAPQSIPMDIQIQNNRVVRFEYMLESDTPDQILNELIQQKKLDSKFFNTFLNQVKETLQLYENARSKCVQQMQKVKQNEEMQLKAGSPSHANQTQKIIKQAHPEHQQQSASFQTKAQQKPGHPIQQQTPLTSSQKPGHPIQQQALLTQSQVHKQSKPDYHTDEFMKRRDEFKKVYKTMNNGIRDFFQMMNNNVNLDVNQVLDAMDYVEEGDRQYKKNFILSLQNVHSQFLAKKTTNNNNKKVHGQAAAQSSLANSQHNGSQANKQAHQSSQLTHSQQQIAVSEKQALSQSQSHLHQIKKPHQGTKKEPSIKAKEVQMPHLRQKKLRFSKKMIDQSDKSLKMVTELQNLINSVKGAIKVSKEVEQTTAQPQNDLTESLNLVLEVQNNQSHEIKVDGQFGEGTEDEIIKLQDKFNIEKDGVVTEIMVQKMEGLLTKLNFINQMKIDKIKEQIKHQNDNHQPSLQGNNFLQKINSSNNLLEESKKPMVTPIEIYTNNSQQVHRQEVHRQSKEEDKEESHQTTTNVDGQVYLKVTETLPIEKTKQTHATNNQHMHAQQSQSNTIKKLNSQSTTNSNNVQLTQANTLSNQATHNKDSQNHQQFANPRKKIKPIKEADIVSEEQGSSGGTNPLQRSNQEAPQEEGYDADQTFLTMNSKEQESTNQEEPISKEKQNQNNGGNYP